MKKIVGAMASISFLCLLSVSALANHNDLKEHITVYDKVYVNGVKVKPGSYTVRYNAESGDMTLSKNDKLIVTAKATVTTSTEKFDHDALITRKSTNGPELTGIRLGGQHEEITISQMTAMAETVSDHETVSVIPDGICYITEDGYVLTETDNGIKVADIDGTTNSEPVEVRRDEVTNFYREMYW